MPMLAIFAADVADFSAERQLLCFSFSAMDMMPP